jgi:hypothetical protein
MISLGASNNFNPFLPKKLLEYNAIPSIKTFVEESAKLNGGFAYIVMDFNNEFGQGVKKVVYEHPGSNSKIHLRREIKFDGTFDNMIKFIKDYDNLDSNFFFDLDPGFQQKYFVEFKDIGRSESLEVLAATNISNYVDPINQKQRFHHAVGLEQLKLSIVGLTQVMEGGANSLSEVDLNDGKFAEITGNIASLNELYSEHPESFNPDAIPEELNHLAWSKIYEEFTAIYKSLEPMFEYFEKNRDQLTADFRKTKVYQDMKKTREEAIQAKKYSEISS